MRQLTLLTSEASLASRLEKTRGYGSINQLQAMYMVTKGPLQLNPHDRLHVPGSTNRGNVLGPLSLDDYTDTDVTWCLKVKDKFTLFGRHGPRIAVGGPGGDDVGELLDDELAAAPVKSKPRDKESEEPFLFHSAPSLLFKELLHSVDGVAMIGLAGDGKAALAALELRLPFFGLTFTPEHTKWLIKRLEGQVFKRFHEPQSKLNKPALTKLLSSAGTTSSEQRGKSKRGAMAKMGRPCRVLLVPRLATNAMSMQTHVIRRHTSKTTHAHKLN